MNDKTIKQRQKERRDHRFRVQFHSTERIRFFENLRCEVDDRVCSIQNAHMKSRGAGGTYEDIVPLRWSVHFDFDVMPESKFEAKYGRTKQSIRDRAPHYDKLWRERGHPTEETA